MVQHSHVYDLWNWWPHPPVVMQKKPDNMGLLKKIPPLYWLFNRDPFLLIVVWIKSPTDALHNQGSPAAGLFFAPKKNGRQIQNSYIPKKSIEIPEVPTRVAQPALFFPQQKFPSKIPLRIRSWVAFDSSYGRIGRLRPEKGPNFKSLRWRTWRLEKLGQVGDELSWKLVGVLGCEKWDMLKDDIWIKSLERIQTKVFFFLGGKLNSKKWYHDMSHDMMSDWQIILILLIIWLT